MTQDRDDMARIRPGQPGTTSDPNQANREPARDRGAEQVREEPIDPRPAPRPEERRDDAADPRKG